MPSPSARNQQQVFLRLWRGLQPHVRTDRHLPARLAEALRHREFGARDRRLYRELLYTALRYLPWIEELAARSPDQVLRAVAWLAADTPATHRFREALAADLSAPSPTVAGRAAVLGVDGVPLPGWFRAHCPDAFVPPNLEALLARAPLWIRMQTAQPEAVFAELAARGWRWRESEVQDAACEVLDEADVTDTAAYRDGRFEIQDLGSQLVLGSVDVTRGSHWLDACAGAGGKTLQLAGFVGATGRVDACDVRPAALEELDRRAQRSGISNIEIRSTVPADATYDGVLVDAPCSGSGTWRRAPHLKWCTTPADVEAQAARQQELLARMAKLVRPGGRLVYATCSLSRRENQEVVAAFLATQPDFTEVAPTGSCGGAAGAPGLVFLPAQHNTDGFYVATLRRR